MKRSSCYLPDSYSEVRAKLRATLHVVILLDLDSDFGARSSASVFGLNEFQSAN